MALTEKELKSEKNFPTDKAHNDVADGQGMVVRFYKSHKIAFYFRYRWQGKAAIIKLGSYPKMKLKDARELRAAYKDKIDDGIDPREDNQKTDDVELWTVRRACEAYIESELVNKVTSGHINTVNSMVRKHVYRVVADTLWCDLKRKDWFELVSNCSAPTFRKALLSFLKSVNKYLLIREYVVDDNLSLLTNRMFPKYKAEEKGKLPISVLKPLLIHCLDKGLTNQYACAFLIQILMGSRQSEIRRMEVQDLNLDSKLKIWTVPAHKSKNGNIITRPIPSFMVPYFESLMVNHVNNKASFLFPADVIGQTERAYDIFSTRLDTVSREATNTVFRKHQTRHTLSTTLTELKIPDRVGEKLLGHVLTGTMAHYNKAGLLDEQHDAIITYRDYLLNWE